MSQFENKSQDSIANYTSGRIFTFLVSVLIMYFGLIQIIPMTAPYVQFRLVPFTIFMAFVLFPRILFKVFSVKKETEHYLIAFAISLFFAAMTTT